MPEKCVVYRGERFYVQSSGRYYQSAKWFAPERLLHRRVWADAHGPIPEDCEVHHIDHDWTNNAIENLSLRIRGEHQSEHLRRWWKDPVIGPKFRAARDRNSELAKAWHRSDEGRKWHREHGKRTWQDRERGAIPKSCLVCQKPFGATFDRARFCSHACEQKESYRRHVTTRTCERCGERFTCNKYRATRFCGYVCSNRARVST